MDIPLSKLKLTWAPTGTLTSEPTVGTTGGWLPPEARRTIRPGTRRSGGVGRCARVREVSSSPVLLPVGVNAITTWPKRRVITKAKAKERCRILREGNFQLWRYAYK